MKTSETIKELASALSKFQGEITAVEQKSTNPFFNSKYADLTTLWAAIRPHLADNGLAVMQEAFSAENAVCVVTRLVHSSGEWVESSPIAIPLKKFDGHGTGSALTYARRYGLSSLLGLVGGEPDDDGNAASVNASQNQEPPKTTKKFYPPVDPAVWYNRMSKNFDADDLRLYAQESAEKMGLGEKEAIAFLNSLDDKKFEASFKRWISKKESK